MQVQLFSLKKKEMAIVYLSMAITFCALETVASSSNNNNNQLHPVILIPGSGGNQLEARLTPNYKSSSLLCNKWYPLNKDADGWFRLWFDPSVILRPFTKCFNQRMMTYYDPVKDDYYNAPGVETRVPHFGSTQALLYLDPHLQKITSYMEPLVTSLEEAGYIQGQNLFGAPYDFRYGLAAAGHPSNVASKFLDDLKDLIESATNANGGKPAILLSHSLGGLFALQLLNRNTVSWCNQYIKHFIALSAPWGGTVEQMRTFASGNSFGVPLVDPLLVREEQRSCSTNLWLMPSPKVFPATTPLVATPNSNYSIYDIAQFLKDIGFSQGAVPYKSRILPLVENILVPQVPVTCIFGSGVRTPEMFTYETSDFDKAPNVLYGDGDGTVNMVSLLGLESAWMNGTKDKPLKVINIDGASHASILKDNVALSKLIAEISFINSETGISVMNDNYIM